MNRTLAAVAAAGAMLITSPAMATAPGALAAVGPDDPATHVNESARLDASRVVVAYEGERPPSPMELAEAYATAHGLTCRTPAAAELDDQILTLLVHPLDGQPVTDQIVPVGFDEALESAGVRINLLACDMKAGA